MLEIFTITLEFLKNVSIGIRISSAYVAWAEVHVITQPFSSPALQTGTHRSPGVPAVIW